LFSVPSLKVSWRLDTASADSVRASDPEGGMEGRLSVAVSPHAPRERDAARSTARRAVF
jgi:hypothetical protein